MYNNPAAITDLEEIKRLCADCPYICVKPDYYEEVMPFCDGAAAVKKDGVWIYIDKHGNDITQIMSKKIKDDSLRRFVDGLALFEEDIGDEYSDIRYGYVNEAGIEVIPARYVDAKDFDGGFAEVCGDESDIIGGIPPKGFKWGLIDTTGKVVIPLIYDGITQMGGTVAFKKGTLWGIMDITGKVLTEPKYYRIYMISSKKIAVRKDGLEGVVAPDGTECIPIKFRTLNIWNGELPPYGAQQSEADGGKWGFISDNGNTVLPFKLDGAGSFFSLDCADICMGDKWGVIDINGDIVIPLEYDEILDTCGDLILAVKGSIPYLKGGDILLLDRYGKNLLPVPFHSSQPFREGLAWLGTRGLWCAVGSPEYD